MKRKYALYPIIMSACALLCFIAVVIMFAGVVVYFEDLTYDEAAKVMKKNRKQVDNLLYRAKKELRIILGKDGELLL